MESVPGTAVETLAPQDYQHLVVGEPWISLNSVVYLYPFTRIMLLGVYFYVYVYVKTTHTHHAHNSYSMVPDSRHQVPVFLIVIGGVKGLRYLIPTVMMTPITSDSFGYSENDSAYLTTIFFVGTLFGIILTYVLSVFSQIHSTVVA